MKKKNLKLYSFDRIMDLNRAVLTYYIAFPNASCGLKNAAFSYIKLRLTYIPMLDPRIGPRFSDWLQIVDVIQSAVTLLKQVH